MPGDLRMRFFPAPAPCARVFSLAHGTPHAGRGHRLIDGGGRKGRLEFLSVSTMDCLSSVLRHYPSDTAGSRLDRCRQAVLGRVRGGGVL